MVTDRPLAATVRHRVLVVEDDTEIRESLLEVLEEHGHEAIGAVNGREALDWLAAADPLPCLILLDLMMPVMDGAGFREEQLRTPRIADVPVVLVSAHREVAANARGLRAAAHLGKPLDLDELLRVVHDHCARAAV
jgi:DNA-binding response OmpR family regulator